jgi:hypothetical protein
VYPIGFSDSSWDPRAGWQTLMGLVANKQMPEAHHLLQTPLGGSVQYPRYVASRDVAPSAQTSTLPFTVLP